jgi:phosphoesterase RecJ-like protein
MHELLKSIRAAERINVIAHIHPDGDAVGSVVGLQLGLQQLGKKATAVLADGVPPAFQFLCQHTEMSTDLPPYQADQPALCIVLDLADAARTGFRDRVEEYGKAGMLCFIDHHPLGDLQKQSKAYYHTINTSSCAELVYQVLRELGVRFTPPIATALLTGMYTDTGGFQYSNTSTDTLEVGAELMRRGGRLRTIVDHTSSQKSIASLRLLGIALERLSLTRHESCAVSVITAQDMTDMGAAVEDAAGIINQLNVLPGPKICMLITEIEPGVIRGSLRSNDHPGHHAVNVTPLARLLGGGGHARASGFLVNGHIERVEGSANQWRVI